MQTVARRSLIWLVLIFAITITAAYLYLRWTKPLYESSSELKLDVRDEATELGIVGINENKNLNVISGEIELLKSKLFLAKVIESVDMDVSYYTAGQMLVDEKHLNAPIDVAYNIKSPSIYNKRIYVDLIDKNTFKISFYDEESYGDKVYHSGETIRHPDADLKINTTKYYEVGLNEPSFFVINSKDALLNYFQQNLNVQPLNLNANTIKISLTDHNQLKARDLVNAIDSIYLQYTREEKNKENKQKIAWLNTELSQIEQQLEGYENYFETFTIENRTNNLDEDLASTISIINQLDSQKYILTRKINHINELLNNLDTEVMNGFFDVTAYQLPENINTAFEELVELTNKRNQLRLSYKETTFALAKVENQLQATRTRIIGQLTALKNSYQDQVSNLNSRRQQLENEFITLPGKSTEYSKNQRFFQLYEEFYLSLMQSKAEYQIAQAGTTTEFKILSPANLPTEPISPQTFIIYGIGLVSGFIISFFFVSIRYLLHNKITTTAELEKMIAAPMLGTIPSVGERLNKTQLIIHKNPKSAVSEALRSIRTNIEFMASGNEKRVISVTSTISGEGKTFVAVNLGGIIALSKKKVVVLDLDMRKPKVHDAFDHSTSDKGLSTILIQKHAIKECIRHTEIDNLDYIAAGPIPPNPSELLLNEEFNDLLKKLKKKYDLVILDTPPVGLVTDGVLCMKKADLGLYIVRANYSKKEFSETLNKLIKVNQFRHMAVILNATTINGRNNYGYGYYEEATNEGFLKRITRKSV